MKKLAIIMGNLKNFGGAQKTAIVAIEAVNSLGIVPDVYAFTKGNSFDIKRMYKKEIKFNFKQLYGKSNLFKNIQVLFFKNNYDAILDFITFLPFIDYKNYFHYIHFPEYAINDYNKKQQHNIKDKLYFYFRKTVIEPFQKRNYKKYKNITQSCNSQFTQEVLEKTINKRIDVLYPPIDTTAFECKEENERFGVATLARISKEKNQLEQIKIAQKLPNIEFNICGAAEDKNSYIDDLKLYIKNNNIKNVNLHINEPFTEIQKILCKSKFFVHSMRNEHFGMSTVEAICSGCIPIVHDSGGQKFIVEKNYLLYVDTNDAIEKIKELYYNENKIKELKLFFNNKKKIYDEFTFKHKIIDWIEKN